MVRIRQIEVERDGGEEEGKEKLRIVRSKKSEQAMYGGGGRGNGKGEGKGRWMGEKRN